MAVAERTQVDAISAQAAQVEFWRTVLTVLASVLFSIGWALGRTWFALVWCGLAVKVGWQSGSRRESSDVP